MKNIPDVYHSMSELEKAEWREKNLKPKKLSIRSVIGKLRKIYCSDGTIQEIRVGRKTTGDFIFPKLPEGHPEDWSWTLELVGDPYVAFGKSNALAMKCEHPEYMQAKLRNQAADT